MKERHLKSELFRRVLGLVVAVFILVSGITALMHYQFSKAEFLAQNERLLSLMNQQTKHFLQHPKKELQLIEAAMTQSNNTEDLEREVLFIVERFSYIYRLEHIGADGRILETFPASPAMVGLDYSRNPVYTDSVSIGPGEFVFGGTFIDPLAGFSSVSITMKAADGSTLVGYINLDQLKEAISIIDSQKLDYAVLDENGYYLMHSQESLVLQRELDPDYMAIQSGLLENGDLVIHNQNRHFIQFQEIASTGWTLALYQDLESMLQPIFLSLIFIIFAFFVFGVSVTFFANKTLDKVETTLHGFIRMTKDVSRGQYEIEAERVVYSEFQDLSLNFEKMIEEVEVREEKILALIKDLEENYLNTVFLLSNTIEAKDSYTGNHCERVEHYAMMMGRKLDLDEMALTELSYGSQLHDIGKLSISEAILTKPSRLNEAEYDLVRRHSEFGYSLLRELPEMERVKEIVLFHHERYDGAGYPRGLAGENIPLLARIVGIADAYDAMTSERVYRDQPLTQEEAVDELIRNQDQQFDGRLVEIFIQCLGENHVMETKSESPST